MQLAGDLGLRLLVNNSWSGSTLYQTRAKTKGAFADRCVQLHDDTGINEGAEPDLIFVYLGTNDFMFFPGTLGTAEIDYDSLFPEDGSGKRAWGMPSTSLEAAAVILQRIRWRYPGAEVYVIELLYRNDLTEASAEVWRQFNRDLGEVAEHFGAVTVRFSDSPIGPDTAELYFQDGRLHPNALGMDVITEAVKRAVLDNTRWKTGTFHPVTLGLSGVLADCGCGRLVREGQPFAVTLTAAEEGAELSVRVTADGEDITGSVVADGVV